MSNKNSATPTAPAETIPEKPTPSLIKSVRPLTTDISSQEHNTCIQRIETAVNTHNHIKKVLTEIDNLGCQLPDNFFACRTCDAEMFGGFLLPKANAKKYNPKIILCEDKKIDNTIFQQTLLHELIHAYDLCRAKVDVTNCKHYACTEIRASSLRLVFVLE